ncbi:hypothetical protein D3C85_1711510 [compost metagenome]
MGVRDFVVDGFEHRLEDEEMGADDSASPKNQVKDAGCDGDVTGSFLGVFHDHSHAWGPCDPGNGGHKTLSVLGLLPGSGRSYAIN